MKQKVLTTDYEDVKSFVMEGIAVSPKYAKRANIQGTVYCIGDNVRIDVWDMPGKNWVYHIFFDNTSKDILGHKYDDNNPFGVQFSRVVFDMFNLRSTCF